MHATYICGHVTLALVIRVLYPGHEGRVHISPAVHKLFKL